MIKEPTTRREDKFLGFLAVTPNKKFMQIFDRADVKNVLVSYHYIKRDKVLTGELIAATKEKGGLFMTDSGIFSFLSDKKFNAKTFGWVKYLEEYVGWLEDNKANIFSAVNLDADDFVVRDDILKWNEKYFEPLHKDLNIIYAAHMNCRGMGDLDGFKYYAKKYDYVAVNEGFVKHVAQIYQEAKITKTSIHGLAWTKPSILREFPFLSVDSTSWVNYQKYGATPVFDGTNFTQYDKDNKHIRKTLKTSCQKMGIKFYEFCNEKNEADGTHNDDEGLTFSVKTWLNVFENIKVQAKIKLKFTLNHYLTGKLYQMEEDVKQEKKKRLSDRLIGKVDVELTEVVQTNYLPDEKGNLTAVYEKRELSQVSDIDDFDNTHGGVMVCDFCSMQDKCPKFKANSTCGFNFKTPSHAESPMATIDSLIMMQMERVNRAMMMEKMEGGGVNKIYSAELRILNDLNRSKVDMLMLVQGRGLKITQTTLEYNVATYEEGGKKEVKQGFAQMLQTMMSK